MAEISDFSLEAAVISSANYFKQVPGWAFDQVIIPRGRTTSGMFRRTLADLCALPLYPVAYIFGAVAGAAVYGKRRVVGFFRR